MSLMEVKDMEKETLATELIHELKAQSKRWFVAFIVVLALWFGTIGVFIWYISLPIDEYSIITEQDTDGGGNNYTVGGDYHGETENKNNEETERP